MTIAQLRDANWKRNKRVIICSTVSIIFLLAYIGICDFTFGHDDVQNGDNYIFDLIRNRGLVRAWPEVVARLIAIFLLVAAGSWVYRTFKSGPRCPFCQHGWDSAQIVEETGTCSNCGKSVLVDGPIHSIEPSQCFETFVSASANVRRQLIRSAIWLLFWTLPVLFLLQVAMGCLEAAYEMNVAAPWTIVTFSVWLIGFVLIIFHAWLQKNLAARDPRLCCDYCRKPVVGHGGLVITTKMCPHCGRPFFGQEYHSPAAPRRDDDPLLLDIDQFVEAIRKLDRRAAKIGFSVLVLFFVFIGIGATILPNEIFGWVVLSGIGLGTCALIGFAKYDRDEARCPKCKKDFYLRRFLAIATRTCPHCKERIFSEPQLKTKEA